MGQLTNQFVSQSYQGLLNLANANTGFTANLQTVTDGLGGSSPLQISQTQVNISGAFTVNGQPISVDSGSLVTTSSFNAYTSSVNLHLAGLDVETGSLQNQINGLATTSSLSTLSGSIAVTDLAQNNRLTSIEGITGSLATTSSLNSYTLTSSFNAYTSSNDGRVSSLESKTGSYATTGSNTFIGTQTINGQLQVSDIVPSVGTDISIVAPNVNVTGSLNVTGEITALSASITYLETIYQTSSIIFSSGSNILGDASNDTQTLWGTVNLPTGPLVITGSVTSTGGFNGNLTGTASFATNALSSSHAIYADTASYYGGTVVSASFATNAATASIANDLIVRGKCDNPGGLTRGTIVRIVGANGDNPLFDSASWTDDFNSANTLGMLSEDAVYNSFANVVVQGKVIGINTNGMAAGSLLFLSSSGQYTTSSVPAPYHEVRLGQVLRDNTNNGSAYITVDNGYELTELHDVNITSPVVGDVLTYVSGAYGQWENKTVSELGYLQTSSFNTYTASMDARTGSYATTGSNNFIGVENITGSLTVTGSVSVSGSVDVTGSLNEKGNLYVINPNMTNTFNNVTSSYGGNVLFGWDGISAPQLAATGSYVISGSNNILNVTRTRPTVGMYYYLSGSNNIGLGGGISLSTGSLLRPVTSNNLLNSSVVQLTFASSSVAGGQPVLSNNIVNNSLLVDMGASGSITATNNFFNGGTIIYQTGSAIANLRSTFSGNIVNGGSFVVQNFASSSFNLSNNTIIGAANEVDNSFVNTFGTNGATVNRNLIQGQVNYIVFSGSPSSNTARAVSDNFLGGNSVTLYAQASGSNAGNSYGTLMYGFQLVANANSTGIAGGSAFLGRFNDTGSLANTQDIVFAVGTGTSVSLRRTGLYVTTGSLVVVSGSMDVKGNSTFTGSLGVSGSVTVTGSINQSGSYTTNGTVTTTEKFLAAGSSPLIEISGSNPILRLMENSSDGLYATVAIDDAANSANNMGYYLSTYTGLWGSNPVATFYGGGTGNTLNGGSDIMSAYNGKLSIYKNTEISGSLIVSGSQFKVIGPSNITGSLTVSGSATITGSVQGNVNNLTVASNTASLNLNDGNFFVLALTGSQDIRIEPSNIKAGQTINVKLNTTGSGTVSFPTSVKQVSGSAYVPSTGTTTDIITLVSFDNTNLFLANVKNLI